MDITFLAPCKDLSGGIKVIATYAELLQARGHNVTVVYPRPQIPKLRKLKRDILNFVKRERDHLDAFTGKLLAVDQVNDNTIPHGDILIATAWETAEWARDLSETKGRKFYLIQGHEVWNGQQARVYATLKLPFTKITISSWLKSLISEISRDQHIELIPNGCDFVLTESQALTDNRKYDVGMTYSSIPNKGADIGLRAMFKLARHNPTLKFAVFGTESPDVDLPLNMRIFVKPSRATIAKIYQQTKIWMSSSYEEGFCLPCLEAMSSGAVVVSTDNKGVRDMIQNGTTGFLTPTGKDSDLAARVNFLLENPASLKRMQKQSYEKSTEFSWQQSADQFERLLSQPNAKQAA
ncbi:MAG: glycosyltransferase family 4 protein [Candidatus Marinimicrobia bacterium]|jgi:glycosyltransferase involved in cell wall biosynthesis|nr:glycosyltransferase family 4 protein [Candidatus Neomarinimicrobiota bacterium]MBT4036371.1 glycosyltransferase family 4 protein [Candidatus Neomarinimicrobiota bacterium]MBT4361260.1 glycosyltransferase family 4 protein [Candidatus Neomarinimicrobiota bacterium]MBT4716093.1 glycosyltransferase family 4 protein [Candidatus Neomarinimicrobiota bacterium]MBT4945225.1 glycosyltransferase family 4 protein [Candidatus Neomarinimicrobiota bacterium]